MRIWDLPPRVLCRQHLLGEHRELHAIWAVITGGRKGYARHPETLRWVGKLRALYRRHEALVAEMRRRGYAHESPLDARRARGAARQTAYVDTPAEQRRILRKKGCACRLDRAGGADGGAGARDGGDPAGDDAGSGQPERGGRLDELEKRLKEPRAEATSEASKNRKEIHDGIVKVEKDFHALGQKLRK